MNRILNYFCTICVALSVLLNAFLGGEACETTSYRAAKARGAGKRWGCVLCRFLDAVHPDHCERASQWWSRKR